MNNVQVEKDTYVRVTERVFLKVYFAMAIETKELQHKLKGLLKESKSTYTETLHFNHLGDRA